MRFRTNNKNLAFSGLQRASSQTHPLFGPLGMNQGTTPPIIPQNRVITDMAITKLSSAMVGFVSN